MLDNDEQTKFVLQNNMGTIIKRKSQAVVRYYRGNRHKDPERYYTNLVTVYFPHRSNCLETFDYENFTALFKRFSDEIIANMKQYKK